MDKIARQCLLPPPSRHALSIFISRIFFLQMLSLGQLACSFGRDSPSERMQNAGRSVTRWLLPLPTLGFPFTNFNVDPTTRNALLPIHKLPVELLGEIFLFSLHDNVETTPFPPLTESPLIILSQICRHWRHMIVNTPALWSNIIVPDVTKRNPQAVALWLERSKQIQLSISLIADPVFDDEEWYNSLGELLSLLVPQSHRWRSLHLETHFPHPLLLSIPPAHISNLEKIDLRIDLWPEEEYLKIWNIIHSSPLLRDVAYGHFQYGSDAQNWESVTRMTITHPVTTNTALALLRDCRALRSIRLVDFHGDYCCSIRDSPSNILCDNVVDISELQELVIEQRTEHGSSNLFDSIVLRKVKALAFKVATENPAVVGLDAVQRCLGRSNASLETFSFGTLHFDSNEGELIDFLSHSTSRGLKELKVLRGIVTRKFVDFLTNPGVLRSMKSVTLRGIKHIDVDVISAVTRRRSSPTCARITRIEVRDDGMGCESQEDRYADALEEGLELYIRPYAYDFYGY